jgi:hypothetical protein
MFFEIFELNKLTTSSLTTQLIFKSLLNSESN